MNKNKIPILVFVTALCLILFCNFCKVNVSENTKEYKYMDVVATHGTKFTNYYDEYIVVVLNGYNFTDFDTCAKDIIQNVIEDNFYSTCFDWSESGYPNSLSGTVFLSESDWRKGEPLFSFDYNTDAICNQYDIRDKDEYELTITD